MSFCMNRLFQRALPTCPNSEAVGNVPDGFAVYEVTPRRHIVDMVDKGQQ